MLFYNKKDFKKHLELIELLKKNNAETLDRTDNSLNIICRWLNFIYIVIGLGTFLIFLLSNIFFTNYSILSGIAYFYDEIFGYVFSALLLYYVLVLNLVEKIFSLYVIDIQKLRKFMLPINLTMIIIIYLTILMLMYIIHPNKISYYRDCPFIDTYRNIKEILLELGVYLCFAATIILTMASNLYVNLYIHYKFLQREVDRNEDIRYKMEMDLLDVDYPVSMRVTNHHLRHNRQRRSSRLIR